MFKRALHPIHRVLLSLFAVSALMSASAVMADDEPSAPSTALEVIREASESLLQTLKGQAAELRKNPQKLNQAVNNAVLPVLDFPTTSRLVLGKNFRKANADQRARFEQAFQGMLLRTYAASLLRYADDINIDYLPVPASKRPDRQVIHIQISYKGNPPINVSYYMHNRKGGEWLIYDVKILGVSAVVTFRKTFAEEIKQFGMDGFLERLEEKSGKAFQG